MNKTQDLYRKAKKIIPGGTQLLSKRPEMMAPELWPAYYQSASGCEVTDLDGKRYYDMSTNGIGACLLGFANPAVVDAVVDCVKNGSMSSLNPPEEVELAEELCKIHPWASQVRYTRSGGEAMAVAVRIARATTDRSGIAICGYHGWTDWYIAANLGDNENLRNMLLPGLDAYGVPQELRGTTLTFKYGDVAAFRKLIQEHGKNLAAIVMEPIRHHAPPAGFLELIRAECDAHGILLVFDEITIGWRYTFGGSHLKFGVTPDIAVFAKALGNGHPMGAIIGSAKAMEGAQKSFISSTYWTERTGPVAALATLREMRRTHAAETVDKAGKKFLAIVEKAAQKAGLKIKITTEFGCLATFAFDYPNALAVRTYFTQLMLEKGFLAGCGFYPTIAHTDEILAKFEHALTPVFAQISADLANNMVEKNLKGPLAHTGFSRLN